MQLSWEKHTSLRSHHKNIAIIPDIIFLVLFSVFTCTGTNHCEIDMMVDFILMQVYVDFTTLSLIDFKHKLFNNVHECDCTPFLYLYVRFAGTFMYMFILTYD